MSGDEDDLDLDDVDASPRRALRAAAASASASGVACVPFPLPSAICAGDVGSPPSPETPPFLLNDRSCGAGSARPPSELAISCSTIKLALPSRIACSVLSSRTHSRRSCVEPTSLTEPSSACSMMGIASGLGFQLSTTSTSTTSS